MKANENLDFKPSQFVNIAYELTEIIEKTKKYARHPEISQQEWNKFILSQKIQNTLHENLCITPNKKIPWEWRQDDETGRINIFVHFVREDRVIVDETSIRSPKLYGEFWSPVQDIKIQFDDETSTTVVGMTPKDKIRFPVLIRCGLEASKIQDSNANSDDPSVNYTIYDKNKTENDPEIDPHSMFFLGMLSMLYSKDYFYDWLSIAASLGEQNAMSYLARVCLGDNRISEAVYWFARLTLDFGFKPATLDLSIILIQNEIKPLLAENLLCNLCRERIVNGFVELAKLYLNGCNEKSKEVEFEKENNGDQNEEDNNNENENNENDIEKIRIENSQNLVSIPKDVEKGLKILRLAIDKYNSEEAAYELKKYNDEHPFGEFTFTDIAISTGVAAIAATGAFWLLRKFVSSRKK